MVAGGRNLLCYKSNNINVTIPECSLDRNEWMLYQNADLIWKIMFLFL